MDALKPLFADMRVDLGGAQVGMPEEFLHSTKIGTAVQKMSGVGVS